MRRTTLVTATACSLALLQLGCRDVPTQPLAHPNPAASFRHAATTATRVEVGDFIADITFSDLGPGSGKSINESGTIAGYVGNPANPTNQLWYEDGTIKSIWANCPPPCGITPFPGCDPLGDPGCQPGPGTPSVAFDANNRGKVVGYYSYSERFLGPWSDAFVWSEGAAYLTSPFLHHHDTRLYAINDAGVAVGSYQFAYPGQVPPAATHAAVLRSDGTLRDLGAPVGTRSVAYDINERGDVVGQSPGPDDFGSGQAILWPAAGGFVNLGSLGSGVSSALAINEDGVVVGWSYDAIFNRLPFRWTATTGLKALSTHVGVGAAYGLNDDGYVAGEVRTGTPASPSTHAALWTPTGALIDLPDLGSLRSRATAINSRLEITGEAVDANLVTHAIRWTVAIVSNRPPNVEARGPYTGTEGTAISFSGSASDPSGGTVDVVWDFGDGISAAGLTSSHVYADNGMYTATLTATSATGLRASATSSVTVANVPPVVHLVAPSPILSGDTFPLQATFGDPGVRDMPWTYAINWGLGPALAGSTSSQSDPLTANSPRYCAASTYAVKVEVTDKDGGAGSSTASLTVNRITVPMRILTETINPRSKGTLAVAVLSTSAIDAREIDVATLTLGDQAGNTVPVARHPNGQFFVSFEDVDHDGRADLVAHFSREAVSSTGVLSSPTAMLWTFARLSDGCREVMGNAELRVLDKRN